MVDFGLIFDKQKEFEDLVIMKSKNWPDKPLQDFTQKEKVAFSKELCLYLYQEVGEYVNAVGNYKMHKEREDKVNESDVKSEIADIFIFAIDLALIMNMNGDELLNKIKEKQDKNFKRQIEGY